MAILALVSALAIAGCAATPAEAFGLRVENTPEDILLVFENMPQDAVWIRVHIDDTTETGDPVAAFAFTDIRGAELDAVRQAGAVAFPFPREGRTYSITVFVGYSDGGFDQTGFVTAQAEITASSTGIYVVNDVTLELNDALTVATLSQEPVFSAEVQFYSPRFTYSAIAVVAGNHVESTDDLVWAWDFPEIFYTFRTWGIDFSDDHELSPAYIVVFSNVIHENTRWAVRIARSEAFTVYF